LLALFFSTGRKDEPEGKLEARGLPKMLSDKNPLRAAGAYRVMEDLPTRLFPSDSVLHYPETDDNNPNHDEKDERPIANRDNVFCIGT